MLNPLHGPSGYCCLCLQRIHLYCAARRVTLCRHTLVQYLSHLKKEIEGKMRDIFTVRGGMDAAADSFYSSQGTMLNSPVVPYPLHERVHVMGFTPCVAIAPLHIPARCSCRPDKSAVL